MKEDLIKRLVETFKQETEKYSNLLEGVINYRVEEYFKKNNPEKGYHSVGAWIIFKKFVLKLDYKINVSMLIPKSTIEMRFLFEDGKLPVEYSIYDLFDIVDNNNFKCYTFPYVTSETKMIEVLNYLVETFLKYKDKIQDISKSAEQIAMLEKIVDEKTTLLLDEKIFESKNILHLMRMLELYYVLDISRFTMEGYLDYINGKYKKSIKKYNKLGNKLTVYEKKLIAYIEDNNIEIPVEGKLNTMQQARRLKTAKIELLPMILSWIALIPIWYIVYSLVFYISLHYIAKGAIYVGGADAFMVFMPAFLTAIVSAFFTRRGVYKLMFKKDYTTIVALDEIENGEKTYTIMAKLLQFVIALGLVISVLAANTNISFYENGFKDNLNFLNIKGETILYENVDCVYSAKAITNDFGEIINLPTYVISLNNGKKIDLFYYMEFDEIKQNIIPILEKNNVPIIDIDMLENVGK